MVNISYHQLIQENKLYLNKTVGNFTFIETPIKDVYEIEIKRYGDNRGYFMETYKKADFDKAGLIYDFV